MRRRLVLAILGVGLCACSNRGIEEPELPWPPAGFAFIRSGTFTMGSPLDEEGHSMRETQHTVVLTRSLLVLDHEVTQAEWSAVMGWNESPYPGENRPVTRVSWFDAVQYCIERSEREGLDPAYTLTDTTMEGVHVVSGDVEWDQASTGYRLLTEAEWEYTCRAGSQDAFCNGPIFTIRCPPPSNPTLDLVAWYCIAEPHEVARKEPNAWGVYDMHGNAEEWCWDRSDYSEYGPGSATDPIGTRFGTYRVYRSGSAGPNYCRSAWRGADSPRLYYHLWRGLRIARTDLAFPGRE
jgi:formylglycine-generating enzyme required for sulfatase activity